MAIRIAGVALALLIGTAGTAFAGNRHGPITFEGNCELSGVLRQSPPLTNLPQDGSATARAQGTCSGTLTGARGHVRRLEDAPSRYFAQASGSMSCGGGSSDGTGVLRIAGRKIRFSFSEVRGPGVAAVTLEGRGGGSASVVEDPRDGRDRDAGGVGDVLDRGPRHGALSLRWWVEHVMLETFTVSRSGNSSRSRGTRLVKVYR